MRDDLGRMMRDDMLRVRSAIEAEERETPCSPTVTISLNDAKLMVEFMERCKADRWDWRYVMPAIDRLEQAIASSSNAAMSDGAGGKLKS